MKLWLFFLKEKWYHSWGEHKAAPMPRCRAPGAWDFALLVEMRWGGSRRACAVASDGGVPWGLQPSGHRNGRVRSERTATLVRVGTLTEPPTQACFSRHEALLQRTHVTEVSSCVLSVYM